MVSRPDTTTNNSSDGEGSDNEVADEDEEEGDVHSRALMHLFEISLELLSLSTEQQQATRGLRDSVKKTWQVIMVVQGAYISVDVLDSIVAAVIGEHPEEQDEEGHENQEEDDQIEEEHSDASDNDSVEVETPKQSTKHKKSKSDNTLPNPKSTIFMTTPLDGEVNNAAIAVDEDDDELITDEAAFDMLLEGVDEDNSDNEEVRGGGLEHTAEVDDALAQMIALKQQSRKAGVLLAHRRALLVRSRSIDILEV